MKLQYLGTAAAEAIPALFCHCDTCQRARQAGGRDIRGRSGLVINETTLIDFPPDIYFLSLKLGLDLGSVRDIFITHSHGDHFDYEELSRRCNGMYCHVDIPYIHLYGNDGVAKIVRNYKDGDMSFSDFSKFTETQYGENYTSESGLVFTYLPSRHMQSEHSGFYMVEGEGKRILYAQDTGLFPEETFEQIQGKRFDLVSLDCCFGKLTAGISSHMGISENRQTVKRLREIGCVDEHTTVVINHFSHNCGQLQSELEAEVKPDGFQVAYDGMIINV